LNRIDEEIKMRIRIQSVTAITQSRKIKTFRMKRIKRIIGRYRFRIDNQRNRERKIRKFRMN